MFVCVIFFVCLGYLSVLLLVSGFVCLFVVCFVLFVPTLLRIFLEIHVCHAHSLSL